MVDANTSLVARKAAGGIVVGTLSDDNTTVVAWNAEGGIVVGTLNDDNTTHIGRNAEDGIVLETLTDEQSDHSVRHCQRLAVTGPSPECAAAMGAHSHMVDNLLDILIACSQYPSVFGSSLANAAPGRSRAAHISAGF